MFSLAVSAATSLVSHGCIYRGPRAACTRVHHGCGLGDVRNYFGNAGRSNGGTAAHRHQSFWVRHSFDSNFVCHSLSAAADQRDTDSFSLARYSVHCVAVGWCRLRSMPNYWALQERPTNNIAAWNAFLVSSGLLLCLGPNLVASQYPFWPSCIAQRVVAHAFCKYCFVVCIAMRADIDLDRIHAVGDRFVHGSQVTLHDVTREVVAGNQTRVCERRIDFQTGTVFFLVPCTIPNTFATCDKFAVTRITSVCRICRSRVVVQPAF